MAKHLSALLSYRRCTFTLTDENFRFYTQWYFSVTWAYMKSDTLRCLRAPVWKYKIYMGLLKICEWRIHTHTHTRVRGHIYMYMYLQRSRNKRFTMAPENLLRRERKRAAALPRNGNVKWLTFLVARVQTRGLLSARVMLENRSRKFHRDFSCVTRKDRPGRQIQIGEPTKILLDVDIHSSWQPAIILEIAVSRGTSARNNHPISTRGSRGLIATVVYAFAIRGGYTIHEIETILSMSERIQQKYAALSRTLLFRPFSSATLGSRYVKPWGTGYRYRGWIVLPSCSDSIEYRYMRIYIANL